MCWRCPISPPWSSRSAAPHWARTPGARTSSEFHVELKADADVDQSEAEDALREILSHYPGLQTEVVTFLGDRISESLTGETADIAIKVFGDQLDTLDATGQRIVGGAGAARRASPICSSSRKAARPPWRCNCSPQRWPPAA